MQEKERKSEADSCFCWYNLLISSIKSTNWGEDCTAAANIIAQLLVSHKGISILQVNIAGGREMAVDNGIRTGIFNYGSCWTL